MTNYLKIIFVSVLLVMPFSRQANAQNVGDFGTMGSGNWGIGGAGIWGTWNGAIWIASFGVPSTTTDVYINPGHTVFVEATGKNCKSLIVDTTAFIYANSGIVPERYINVFGNINCKGTIGRGAVYDIIAFNIEGANDTIFGDGTMDASTIRKSAATNPTTNLIINRNINLRFTNVVPASSASLYNNGGAACNFNITISSGDTVNLDSSAVNTYSSMSLDGSAGNSAVNLGGTCTVYGLLNIQGYLYMNSTNTSALYPCNWVIQNGGELRAFNMSVAASAAPDKDTMWVKGGGKLNLTGPPAFSTLSTTNNLFIFDTLSTVEYSAQGNQVVKTSLELGTGLAVNQYYHLILSGSGNKTSTAASNLVIRGNIDIKNTTGSPVFIPGRGPSVGGNWTNYNQSGFTEGNTVTNNVTFNGTSYNGNQVITCPGGEAFHGLTIQNTSALGGGLSVELGDDITVDSVLTFQNTDNVPLNLNGHRLTLTKTVTPTGAVFVFTAGPGYPYRHIVSETAVGSPHAFNPSIIRWRMDAPAGSYIFPFGTMSTDSVPVRIDKKATTSRIFVNISTRRTPLPDNQPWDSTTNVPYVTSMYSFVGNADPDASDSAVVDRWWDITASTLSDVDTTLAVDTIVFNYRGTENTMIPPYNTGLLFAQNWTGTSWFGRNCVVCNLATLGAFGKVVVVNDTIRYAPWVLPAFNHRLPIQLLDFTAHLDNGHTDVKWITSSETNCDKFVVERSKDAYVFEAIGEVKGAGNSSVSHSYNLTDWNPLKGLSYYRLRQTDFDGQFTFSNLVPVLNLDKNSDWYVFPNPAADEIHLANSGNHILKNSMFQLYSPDGSLVRSMSLNNENQTMFTVDLQNLSSGIYIGKITDDYNQQVFKIIKN